jgi:hypothetical protein
LLHATVFLFRHKITGITFLQCLLEQTKLTPYAKVFLTTAFISILLVSSKLPAARQGLPTIEEKTKDLKNMRVL